MSDEGQGWRHEMSTRGERFDMRKDFRKKQAALVSTIVQLGDVIRSLRAEVRNLKARANRAERESDDVRKQAAATVRLYLAFDSQRAVSWHEVQDCAEAIEKGTCLVKVPNHL